MHGVDAAPESVHGDFSAVSGEKITENVAAVTEINSFLDESSAARHLLTDDHR
jgi:hypothetical protein